VDGANTAMIDYTIPCCEHERHWITKCNVGNNTAGWDTIKYRSYSCNMFFCQYPEKDCRVKRSGDRLE